MSNFYNQASWVLVPSGIEEDIVFAQKPISGLGDLSFTRASDATYTDSTGVVRRSPYNLLTFSNTFSNAIWTKAGTPVPTLTAGELGRDGLNNAWRVQWGTTANTSYILQSITVTNHTASIYIKGTAGHRICFGVGVNVSRGSQFELDGTWQRLTFSATSGNLFFFSTFSITGTVASDFLIQDAQLVEGTSALDYFPTTNRQDVPRIDFRNADGTLSSCGRLLLEPQRTNSIRNSSMVGAVAGSPGTLPTNWVGATSAGLTRTIVAIGTENGLPYIDLRFNGTASATDIRTDLEGATATAAATGQTWTYSLYSKTISGTAPASTFVFFERNSSGSIVTSGSISFSPSSTLTRFSGVRTLNGGVTVAFVQPSLSLTLVNGQTYDFTIRIAAPQMELGGYATTWVPTTTAAVTRLADAASKTGVSSLIGQTEGTLFAEFDNTTTAQGTTRRVFVLSDGSSNNRIGVSINTVNSMDCFVTLGGVPQASIIFGTTLIQRYKVALAYAQNDIVFYVNGVQIGIDTSATIPSLSGIYLGRETGVNDLPLGSGYAQAALFPTRLTNAQLAQLTTL